MDAEKKPLGMSELGCADSCGQRSGKGVAENGWGEEAAGDQRACLRGRLRTAWVQGSGWDAYRSTDKIDAKGWG